MDSMDERRAHPRFPDAEIVMISWQEGSTVFKQLGNVEDLSRDGTGILVDFAPAIGCVVTISYGEDELTGIVRHTRPREGAQFLGIEFTEACKDSAVHFQPELLIFGS